ncbi:Hsp33 family molecular chaperone HslO [Clostridium sp. YIM B02515]|uniref:Hsp33 family molecular chaperone HslO n=1 Tax=Clostridium rhizosphaerae TaxID=2803861 RepID=A0ABS1T485_9CLOT|nr:Hsp33 family molecular chaperone HslO [Clostridium rhizosphaerae]MBL4934134.1 Hsp33 family molecular chaperone HslO [Clostridium rhizosphaerae]
MRNYVIKTLAYNKQVRILFVKNTEMLKKICDNKNMGRLLKIALGKTVSITSLISAILKDNQRISIKVNTSSKNCKIFADADALGNIRGYISDELLKLPLAEANNMSLEQLIGDKGYLQVMKDLGMNSIFTGITEMPYGNIVDDFSYYFKQSEQIPSLFSLNIVLDENNEIISSRGILAQLLPGASIDIIEDIKNIINDNQLLLSNPNSNIAFKEVPNLLFKDVDIMGIHPIQFFCGCSKDIFYPMLYSLNKEELIHSYENNKAIEIVCNVCGKKYSFNKDEIKRII